MVNLSPLVSVVIPTFNATEWIDTTLKSVLRQTYPHKQLEIIIVDDGSTDGTAVTVHSVLSGSNIQWSVQQQQANSGPSHTRNFGWQRARGEWIQFLDADDLLHSDKIDQQIQSAVALSSEVAVIYSDWQRLRLIDDDWAPDGEVVSPEVEKDALVALLQAHNFIATGSQLFRRSWLEKVGGFDERHRLIEDVDLMLRIAMAGGRFYKAAADQPLFFYRHLEKSSLSQRDQRAFIEGCLRNATLAEDYWRSQGDLTPAQTETLIGVSFQGARFFAAVDQARFAQLISKLESFRAPFIPTGPAHLRLASRLLGYPRAEKLAGQYRRMKQIFYLLPLLKGARYDI